MKLIKASAEIWEQGNTLEDIWAHIARCTRVCYQSTPKNDGETDEEFVKRVILRPDSSTGRLNFDKIHGSVLEHGTIYLKGIDDLSKYLLISHYYANKYSKLRGIPDNDRGISNYVVTTNLRVLYENNWLDDLQYICAPTEYHARRVTVSFITNIGVSREFNRHRVNSIAEESTRYCNYYTERLNKSVKFTLPDWISESDVFNYKLRKKENPNVECTPIDYYMYALQTCEQCYNGLISLGWKPQQAREVLPLATKTQLIHTAFVDDWKHFFALRADGVSGPSHPNAALVAKPLKEEFIKRGYI